MRRTKLLVSVVVVGLLAISGLALAQFGGRGGGGRGGPRGMDWGQPGPPPDPTQMHEQAMDRMKQALQVGDEEWKALEPKLDKVMTLSREAGGFGPGRMGGGPPRGGRGGPGAPGAPRPPIGGREGARRGPQGQSQIGQAAEALQTTLGDSQATPDQITAKLSALRAARESAKQELAAAREAVRELVTPRQEAELVLMGLLD